MSESRRKEGVAIAADIKALAIGVKEATENKKTEISDIIAEKQKCTVFFDRGEQADWKY